MIDLTKVNLPTTVNIAGREVEIRTSFRFALVALRLIKEGHGDEAVALMLPSCRFDTILSKGAQQGAAKSLNDQTAADSVVECFSGAQAAEKCIETTPPRRTTGLAAQAVADFLHPHSALPRATGESCPVIMLDYEADSDYIVSAFWQCYGVRLSDPHCDLHWWEFIALLHGLKGTALNDIMDIRAWRPTDKKATEYNREMRKRQAAWEIKAEPTAEEKAAQAAFAALVE